MRLKATEYRKFLKNQKNNKLKNQPLRTEGQYFRSKLEQSVYQILLLRKRAGEFQEIKREVQVNLTCGITHKIDFKCIKNDHTFFYVEAKGMECQRWRLIKKLYKGFGDAKVEVWKGNHKSPYLDEVIMPNKKWQ